MMDTRAQLLLDELSTHPVGRNLDFPYWRGRFQTLFAEKLDDGSRQTLLEAYAAMLDLVERALHAQNGDVASLRNARAADWNTLCIQEALHRSGTDFFEPDDLNEVVQREVAAGRMEANGFSQLAAGGAAFMGRPANERPRKGFFRRFFG